MNRQLVRVESDVFDCVLDVKINGYGASVRPRSTQCDVVYRDGIMAGSHPDLTH